MHVCVCGVADSMVVGWRMESDALHILSMPLSAAEAALINT